MLRALTRNLRRFSNIWKLNTMCWWANSSPRRNRLAISIWSRLTKMPIYISSMETSNSSKAKMFRLTIKQIIQPPKHQQMVSNKWAVRSYRNSNECNTRPCYCKARKIKVGSIVTKMAAAATTRRWCPPYLSNTKTSRWVILKTTVISKLG